MLSHEIQDPSKQNRSVGKIFVRKLAVEMLVQGMGAWGKIRREPYREGAIACFIRAATPMSIDGSVGIVDGARGVIFLSRAYRGERPPLE